MAGCCHGDHCSGQPRPDLNSPRWRRALWVALLLNAGMFLAEIVAGLAAGSAALQADALDFLGDTANYAISLGVAGMALAWRGRAALLKGASLLLLGLWVLGSTAWHAYAGTLPAAEVMGAVGIAALVVNAGVAVLLYRFRSGDANMRSVWICSRNDAIGNVAVVLAAAGVFGTGTGWPDVIVAAVMAALGIDGGRQIVRQARAELSAPSSALVAPAEWSAGDPVPAPCAGCRRSDRRTIGVRSGPARRTIGIVSGPAGETRCSCHDVDPREVPAPNGAASRRST